MSRSHAALLVGLLGLLAAACGDGGSSPAQTTGSCAALGDPAVRCRFVGEWTYGERRPVWVTVAAGQPGSLSMSFGLRGRSTVYRLFAPSRAGTSEFSGTMQLHASFADVPFTADTHAELVDGGAGLRVSFTNATLLGTSTIEASYVGD